MASPINDFKIDFMSWASNMGYSRQYRDGIFYYLRTIEKAYGVLDEHWIKDQCSSVMNELASVEADVIKGDIDHEVLGLLSIGPDGDRLDGAMANRKTALRKYIRFRNDFDEGDRMYDNLNKEVEDSMRLEPEERERRLQLFPKKPKRVPVRTFRYVRNPYVIAKVLIRAKGKCEKCRKNAPFNRKRDNQPYLEVHHLTRLADGGDDTVENAIAVCPNCHREYHYG